MAVHKRLIPDERFEIEKTLRELVDIIGCDLVLTTGGTGPSRRDVTPEATLAVADRQAPGIAEAIRAASMQITPRAMLSRAQAGIRKGTLILNLPGSPKAAKENLEAVLPAISHGLEMLSGRPADCADRLPKEVRCYDFLDRLGIAYQRIDHAPADNMEACEEMGLDKDTYSVTIPLGATINMDGAAITITVMTLAAANTLGIHVDFLSGIVLSILATLAACGASGVAGGSLLLIPMACSLFGISNDIAMQIVGVGFIIGVIQDSVETALNSSSDLLLSASAEFRQWRLEGKEIKY